MFQFYHFNYRPKHIIVVNYQGLGWQTPALMVIAIDFSPESPSLNHKNQVSCNMTQPLIIRLTIKHLYA